MLVKAAFEYRSNPRGYFDLLRQEDGQDIYGLEIRGVGPPFQRLPDTVEEPDQAEAFLARCDNILTLGDSFTMGLAEFEDQAAAFEGPGFNVEHAGELTLVTLGPLTNLARALARDDHEVVVLEKAPALNALGAGIVANIIE